MSDPVVRGRPEAAAAITPPLDGATQRASARSKLQRTGILRGLVATCAAGVLFFFGRWIAAGIALSLGALTLALAIASPTRGYVALNAAVEKVGEAVGAVLSWVLLAPVFYLFLAPFGLLARRGRGDRIGRAYDRNAATYWLTRPVRSDAERKTELERPY